MNKLAGYLAATSRRLDAPLAIVIQSSSAAGKSSLMDAVLALMAEEERVKYSAMTGAGELRISPCPFVGTEVPRAVPHPAATVLFWGFRTKAGFFSSPDGIRLGYE